MSPLSTLINCGSSSIELFLRKLPNFVFLGSSLVACTLSASAFTFIERNLYNLKDLPLYPVLSCLKYSGPLLPAKMSPNHTKRQTNGYIVHRKSRETTKSNDLFEILHFSVFIGSSRNLMILTLPNFEIIMCLLGYPSILGTK